MGISLIGSDYDAATPLFLFPSGNLRKRETSRSVFRNEIHENGDTGAVDVYRPP